MKRRANILAVPVALLLLGIVGFLASGFTGRADSVLLACGIPLFVFVTFLARWYANGSGSAVAGAALAVAVLLAVLYGNYLAYVVGWQGLDEQDLGSDDYSGHAYVLITVALAIIPVSVVGLIISLVGAVVGRRHGN